MKTGYIICGTQWQMKCSAPCLKSVKNLKIAAVEHQAWGPFEFGVLLSSGPYATALGVLQGIAHLWLQPVYDFSVCISLVSVAALTSRLWQRWHCASFWAQALRKHQLLLPVSWNTLSGSLEPPCREPNHPSWDCWTAEFMCRHSRQGSQLSPAFQPKHLVRPSWTSDQPTC